MSDLYKERRKKLEALRKRGVNPFPSRSERTHTAAQALSESLGRELTVAGRIRSWRSHGGSIFCDLQDGSATVQVLFKKDLLGKDFETLALYDLGDFLEVRGRLFETATKQKTVEARAVRIIAKSLNPLPDQHAGLKEQELRHRKRYLDLLANPRTRAVFEIRAKIITVLRGFLDAAGYLEVETPILQPIYGGTLAKPFKTQHNELKQELYLRISNELYLKRLVVGGFEKVYELGRDFRNEGVSSRHNPEFTFMETMRAYADYQDNMQFVQELTQKMAKEVLGTLSLTYQGHRIDLSKWHKVRHPGTVEEFEALEKEWIQPTIVYDFPLEGSPLAKRSQNDPTRVERFEVFIAGLELMNVYSELNDPDELLQQFKAQADLRRGGDQEAHPMDEDFIEVMKYGMPPTSGVGIGIDRLVMLFTDRPSIRDVILFPALKTKDTPSDVSDGKDPQ